MKAHYTLLCFFIFSFTMSCSKKENTATVIPPPVVLPATGEDWSWYADSAQTALTTQFWSVAGKYYNQNNNGHTGFNYWWHAHALDVLVDAYTRTSNAQYLAQMRTLVDGVYAKNGNTMRNTFYDDMEWMGLACLRAFAATGDIFYKNHAVQLWEWIKPGWSTVNNGGIAWSTGTPNSKNFCSNAPASILAARLFQINKNPDDSTWAKKIYDWCKQYVVDPARGLAWDGYGNTNEGNIYTYNQGTYIGAGIEMYRITNDASYITEAKRNAVYIMNNQLKFSPNGILKGENTGDGGLFKGIFIRYLTQLVLKGNIDNATKTACLKYLKDNGISLHSKATRWPEYIFGHDWVTRPATNASDCSVHLSGIMLFEVLADLKKQGLL
jgi:predicted alpha-1,6-mannanase (GH76 family)